MLVLADIVSGLTLTLEYDVWLVSESLLWHQSLVVPV